MTARKVGHQVLLDLVRLDRRSCLDPDMWERAFLTLSQRIGAIVISKYKHVFAPPAAPGLTAYVLLDASHFSIHTYADEGRAAIDLFACGSYDINNLVRELMVLVSISRDHVSSETHVQRFADD